MNFYIATSLDNVAQHHAVRDVLVAAGHRLTYDWTEHGSVQGLGTAVIRGVAVAEYKGVRDADLVVVLGPGGRGTHVELGIAIGLGHPVVIFGWSEYYGDVPGTCAFYHHPRVLHIPFYELDAVVFFVERWAKVYAVQPPLVKPDDYEPLPKLRQQ